MPAIRRRYGPSLEDTVLLPERLDVAFQIDIKKRCGLCRLTGDIQSLAIRRGIERLQAIPYVDNHIAPAPCHSKDTDTVLPLASHQHHDMETVRREVPVIAAHCRVNIDPGQLPPLALHEVKIVEGLMARLALAEYTQV